MEVGLSEQEANSRRQIFGPNSLDVEEEVANRLTRLSIILNVLVFFILGELGLEVYYAIQGAPNSYASRLGFTQCNHWTGKDRSRCVCDGLLTMHRYDCRSKTP